MSASHKPALYFLSPEWWKKRRERKKKKARAKQEGIVWEQYPDWASACTASGGYATEEILKRTRDAARAVRDGKALWERDSCLFYHEEYNFPLMTWLMSLAAWNKGRLCVLDFGGALGSSYMQNRTLLDRLEHIEWHVVEQEQIVACGKKEFTFGALKFWHTIADCLHEHTVNTILLSSVLQYLDEPYDFLHEIVAIHPETILIDRTPFSKTGETIMVQHVPESIYKASYACRFLDREKVAGILAPKYHCMPDYASPVDGKGFIGFMAIRKDMYK